MESWIEWVRKHGHVVRVSDREALFEAGASCRLAYILVDGCVEILQGASNGTSTVVKVLKGPTFFGSVEAISQQVEYLESVRALGAADCAAISSDEFRELLLERPKLAFECLLDMSGAFAVAARFEPARLYETEVLLANLLAAYAQVVGRRIGQGVRIEVRRSQRELADAIGAGERSVNRILASWKDAGLITKESGQYTLLEPHEIGARAGDLAGSLVHAGSAGMGARP